MTVFNVINNRKIWHFYPTNITFLWKSICFVISMESGLGKKIKSNSGLFESMRKHEIEIILGDKLQFLGAKHDTFFKYTNILCANNVGCWAILIYK